jgi:peptide/nickel transport system permease protein
MNQRGHSFVKKLVQNKATLFGISVIVSAMVLAATAYLIVPDGSPYANSMILEIGGEKPGFQMTFLRIGVDPKKNPERTLSSWWQGKPDPFTYIPVKSFWKKGDSLIAERYIDEETTERSSWPMKGQKGVNLSVIKKTFWLGTDKYGRDLLSRIVIGIRVSLSVGLITLLVSLLAGIGLGSMAGYFGGRTDAVIMWFVNVIWSIPTVLLVFAITLVLGKGYWQVLTAIGLTMWVNVARIVRGQVMAIRELEYVEAARVLGFTPFRIITRHILPNCIGPIAVVGASNFASAIIIEAGLSFLGIGVQPPQPSWGLMIKENYNFIITNNPMLALIPGMAILLLVLAFNLLGNGLRDAFAVNEQ